MGGDVLKVFVADDSPLVRERLADLVAELDSVELVGEAGDTREAMDLLCRLKPDVAILDVRMPGGGIQLLEQIKLAPSAPIVIMFTSFAYPQYREKCRTAGAEYFFDKVTEFERIGEVLERLRYTAAG